MCIHLQAKKFVGQRSLSANGRWSTSLLDIKNIIKYTFHVIQFRMMAFSTNCHGMESADLFIIQTVKYSFTQTKFIVET